MTPSHSASDSTPKPAPETLPDAELAAVVAAWSDLPPAIRAGVLALVKAAFPATHPVSATPPGVVGGRNE